MRYLFSLVALLALLSGTSYSQTFNFHRVSSPIVNGDTSLISPTVTYGLLTNTSSSVQRFRIVRIVNSLPATWTSQMCLGMCFGPDVDTLYPYPISVIQMAAGESDSLSIDVFGHNVGTGTIVLKAFNVSNPSAIQVDTFKVHLAAPNAIRENNGIVNGFELKQNYKQRRNNIQ